MLIPSNLPLPLTAIFTLFRPQSKIKRDLFDILIFFIPVPNKSKIMKMWDCIFLKLQGPWLYTIVVPKPPGTNSSINLILSGEAVNWITRHILSWESHYITMQLTGNNSSVTEIK